MKKLNYVLLAIAIICIMAIGVFEFIRSGEVAQDPNEIAGSKGEMVKVYGHVINKSSERLVLDGDSIKDYAELSAALKPFDNLKYLDLGKFELTVSQKKEIQSKYPGILIESKTFANIYGQKIYASERVIDCKKCTEGVFASADVKNLELSDLTELTNALPDLPLVKKVEFGDKKIQFDDLQKLESDFPEVSFDITTTIEICGELFDTDAVKIDLKNVKLDNNFYEKLKYFYKLEEVDARNQAFTTDQKLAISKACPDIVFTWGVQVTKDKVFLSTVENIDLSNKRFKFEDVEKVIPLFYNLKRIDMTDCGFTDEQLAEFRAHCRETYGVEIAWTVRMGRWSLKTDQIAFSVLIYTYDYKRLTTRDIQVLKYCDKIQALDLGHQAITDISVIADNMPDLKVLILADNALSNIEPISRIKHLHYIELFVNSIGDISPLGECKELVDINIGWNYFSDISALLDFPLLERLVIINTRMGQDGINKLRAQYPDVEMHFTGKNSVDCWRGHPRYRAMMHGWYSNCITSDFTKYDGLVVKD